MKIRKLIKIMFMCCALSLVMGVFAFASEIYSNGTYDGKTTITSTNAGINFAYNVNPVYTDGQEYTFKIAIPEIQVEGFLNLRLDFGFYYGNLNLSLVQWNYNDPYKITNSDDSEFISYENNILTIKRTFYSVVDGDNYIETRLKFLAVSSLNGQTFNIIIPNDPLLVIEGPDIPFINSFISGINSVSSSILESTGSIFSFITSSNVLPYVLIGVSVSLVSVIIYFGKRYIF